MDSFWLRRFHPAAPGAPRLVALPHAGGSASFYRPLATALAPSVEVFSVQYPGRQERRREAPLTSINELAAGVLAGLPPSDGVPVALFGHSMGALVAFELALRLEARSGAGPVRVFASGRRAPSVGYAGTQVHRLDDAGLLAEMRRMGGTDERVLADPELQAAILPAVRADYQAVETYSGTPGATLRCPLVVLTGDSDPMTKATDAAAWAAHTTGGCEVHTFAGGHFFLADHLAAVTALVRDGLTGQSTSAVSARAASR